MSIKLKGATSGSVSLDVPAAVSGGDVSLTLPDGVGSAGQYLRNSGTAGTLEFGDGGKVLQVQHGSTPRSSNTSTNSTTYVDTGLFDVSITPLKANSTIIVEFSGYHPHTNASNGNYGGAFKIYRNVNSAGWVDASTNHIEGYYQAAGISGGWHDNAGRSKIVDTPSYTLGNSIQYRLYFRQGSSNTTNFFGHHASGVGAETDQAQLIYILTEVAA